MPPSLPETAAVDHPDICISRFSSSHVQIFPPNILFHNFFFFLKIRIVFSSSFPSFPLLNNLVHESWDHYVRPSKTGMGVVECEGCSRVGPPRAQDVRILGGRWDDGDRGSDMQPGGSIGSRVGEEDLSVRTSAWCTVTPLRALGPKQGETVGQ